MIVKPIANVFCLLYRDNLCRKIWNCCDWQCQASDCTDTGSSEYVSDQLQVVCLWRTQVYLGLPVKQDHYQESCHVTVIEQPWGSVWMCVMGPWRASWGQRSCHSRPWNGLSHNLTGDEHCVCLESVLKVLNIFDGQYPASNFAFKSLIVQTQS